MARTLHKNPKIFRRFIPLYIATFLQSFILWYAIEKLFMHHIGFNDAGIGVMVVIYSCVVLLVETPAGILADRWSRKGMLIIGSVFLAASSLLGGMSVEPVLYVVSAIMWGVFDALYSGMYDSIIYDTIYEETGTSNGYERYAGHIHIAQSVALVASSILGGLVASGTDLPATYFWTIPIALASVIALWTFKEPMLHKKDAPSALSFIGQAKETLTAVLAKGAILRITFVAVLSSLMLFALYEFSTLWLIAIDTPPALYGPAFAVALSAFAAGGVIAGRVKSPQSRRTMTIASFATLLASAIVLTIPSPLFVILLAQLSLGTAATILSILVMRDLHDLLPSHIRAGSSSAVTTFTRVLLIPVAIVFGVISAQVNVFAAAWVFVGLALLAGAGEVKDWLRARKVSGE